MQDGLELSFVNGVIAGAGVSLAIMSIAFLRMTGPLEGKMGFTTTEIRVAIFLGFIVFTIALLYEIYRKKTKMTKDCKEIPDQTSAIDE